METNKIDNNNNALAADLSAAMNASNAYRRANQVGMKLQGTRQISESLGLSEKQHRLFMAVVDLPNSVMTEMDGTIIQVKW